MRTLKDYGWRRAIRTTIAFLVLGGTMAAATRAVAADAKGQEPVAAGPDEKRPATVRIDLGVFHVQDLRPARDITADLKFSLHLVLNDQASEAAGMALRHWKHRLRDQTITAIRMTQMVDFNDPDLTRVRRLIRLRINRVLPQPLVDEILVTAFTLGDM